MTLKKIPPPQQEMRDFVDALRGALGLQPLYTQHPPTRYFTESELPYGAGRGQQWFQPIAGVPEQISEKRGRNIEFAVRKLSQAPPLEQKGAYKTPRKWRPKTQHDTQVGRDRVLKNKDKFFRQYPRRHRGQEKA